MSATFSLEGKNAVVTGLSTGIGRAVAEALAREGANVGGDYQKDAEGAAVTRGLIDGVESENELAFVLAHELGHFHNRDHLRGLGRSAAISLVIGTITSGGSGGFGFGVADLALRAFGREQESDADQFGLELVHAEYEHVAEAWRFFERIETRYGRGNALVNYLETHPLPGDRVEELRQYAKARGWPVEGATTPWQPRGNP